MGIAQVAPAAKVPAVEDALETSGQADAPLLSSVKLVATLGLFPDAGTGKVSGALPAFSMVTVCGLSALVVPGGVLAKFRIGGLEKSTFATELLPTKPM